MSQFITAILLLVFLVGYGSMLKCHTCSNDATCLYGTTQGDDLKECGSRQDRCYRGIFLRGDEDADYDYERGCADQDFCRVERNKQNSNYEVRKCALCDYNGCNSGSLNY